MFQSIMIKSLSVLLLASCVFSASANISDSEVEKIAEIERAKGNDVKYMAGKLYVTPSGKKPEPVTVKIPAKPVLKTSSCPINNAKFKKFHADDMKKWNKESKEARQRQRNLDAAYKEGLRDWKKREAAKAAEAAGESK